MNALRVATLNIWHDSGPWPQRLPLIRREIERLQPGIVGLQEVLRCGDVDTGPATPATCQAMAIAAGTGYHVAYAPAAPKGWTNSELDARQPAGIDPAPGAQAGQASRTAGPSGGSDQPWQGNAILSRWPIREQRAFRLPGADVAEPRLLLYALVQTPIGDLPVFVTHLAWEPHHGPLRLRQVQDVAAQVDALAPHHGPTLPAVILGDFNAEPDSAEMKYLREAGFADAWMDGASGYTFDRVNDYAREADEPSCRIDYILVREGGASPLHTRLAFSDPDRSSGAALWPSDHFGVVSELAFVHTPHALGRGTS